MKLSVVLSLILPQQFTLCEQILYTVVFAVFTKTYWQNLKDFINFWQFYIKSWIWNPKGNHTIFRDFIRI
jgi:hypothetical protein